MSPSVKRARSNTPATGRGDIEKNLGASIAKKKRQLLQLCKRVLSKQEELTEMGLLREAAKNKQEKEDRVCTFQPEVMNNVGYTFLPYLSQLGPSRVILGHQPLLCSSEEDIVKAAAVNAYGLAFTNGFEEFHPSNGPKPGKNPTVNHHYCTKPYCNYSSNRAFNVTRHVLTSHNTAKKSQTFYHCCGLKMPFLALRDLHNRLVHPPQVTNEVVRRLYPCSVCNKVFPYSQELSRHNKIHTGQKDYVCVVKGCVYRSNSKYNLARHTTVLHMQKYNYV
jgi:hypothetical protein